MSTTNNIILVMIDSVNRHHLGCYGASGIRTPNFDRFAERALIFDNHFIGSLPCIPARRELTTGRKEFLWRPWGPLEPFDLRLPELLADTGRTTGIVTDNFHYWEEAGNGYVQGFHSTNRIRGHELDKWKPLLGDGDEFPQWVRNAEHWRPGWGKRYYSNVKDFSGEEDFFPAKVFTSACAWLDGRSPTTPFYLQVESFDVHEPFHTPEPYASMYGPDELNSPNPYFTMWPPYQDGNMQAEYMSDTPAEALAYVRNAYNAKLTMVDTWFGKLLDRLDAENLWETTTVIVTSDHGHDLGERGAFGKSYPHFDSHANIPLLVWHPTHPGNGAHTQGITSTVDLFATVLELAAATGIDPLHSRSLVPQIADLSHEVRKDHIYGSFGHGVCYTDGEWTLMKSPEPSSDSELFAYSAINGRPLLSRTVLTPEASGKFVPDVAIPQWQTRYPINPLSRPNYLFNRREDPEQLTNLWDDRSDVRKTLLTRLRTAIEREGAPAEQYARLGL